MKPRVIFAVAAVATAPLAAQQTLWEPEVRRAEPVHPSERGLPAENPAWMSRVAPAPPPATPLNEPQPSPPLAPAPPAGAAETPAPGSPAEPFDPARDQLEKANSLYTRKMHDFAALAYEQFLEAFPSVPGRDLAWYRLGECRRALGDQNAARQAYERLVAEFQEGEFFASAAYRLGEMALAERHFEEALERFRQSSQAASRAEVRLSARYQAGRCLERLGRTAEAAQAFEDVAAAEPPNPYRHHAMLAHADALTRMGEGARAFAIYQQVAEHATPRLLKEEAAVKAGMAALAAGDDRLARSYFDQVLAGEEKSPWRPQALLGHVRLAARQGRHEEVLKLAKASLESWRGEAKAEALALMADALRALGRPAEATQAWQRLLQEFPESRLAATAKFSRLVALHEANDPAATREIEAFLASEGVSADQRSRASLLLAERLFMAGDWEAAAGRYAEALEGSGLAETVRPQAAYKRAWSLAQAGRDAEAEQALSAFLEQYAQHELAASAFLQRGFCRQKLGRLEEALADFQEVLARHPGTRERETALLQRGLTLGQLQRRQDMRQAFLELLKEFPQGPAAAQAEYWLGWAALEEKDYAAAVPRLTRARELDPTTFGERVALRLALCYYHLQQRAELLNELARLPEGAAPREILRWAGLRSAQEADFPAAERCLAALPEPDAEALVALAESRLALGKYAEAAASAQAAAEAAQQPASRARALLAEAEARRGLQDFAAAEQLAEAVMELQPEGRWNALGRMVLAEVAFARGDFEEAARAFMAVALLYEDEAVTPRALDRAAESYRRARREEEAMRAAEELRRRFPSYTPSTAQRS